MVVSGQMTREEALAEYSEPLYDEQMMKEYIAYIKKQLCISDEEFDAIMSAPAHQHTDYRTENDLWRYQIFRSIKNIFKKFLNK